MVIVAFLLLVALVLTVAAGIGVVVWWIRGDETPLLVLLGVVEAGGER
jgi:hypothetical protein